MRHLAAGVAVAAALAAAGCGGNGGGKSVPAGAAKTPADAVAFVSLKTDASNDQWDKSLRLASRFPALAGELGKLERYRRALGPEVDYVWSDFRNGGDDSVLLTKPKDLARVKTLLGSHSSYANLGDGWVAFGDYAAQFKPQAEGDKLDGDKTFKDAFGNLDESAPVRAWVRGRSVQTELDRALESGGAAPEITQELGDLKSIAGFARAEGDGARIELSGTIDPPPSPATFEPSLPKSTPSGAVLYVSSTQLRAPPQTLLRLVAKSNPMFETRLQRAPPDRGDRAIRRRRKGRDRRAPWRQIPEADVQVAEADALRRRRQGPDLRHQCARSRRSRPFDGRFGRPALPRRARIGSSSPQSRCVRVLGSAPRSAVPVRGGWRRQRDGSREHETAAKRLRLPRP
jgi:hypothetical protein